MKNTDHQMSAILALLNTQALTEMHIRSYTKQLLEGVNFLHLNKILHRDIKGTVVRLLTRHQNYSADIVLTTGDGVWYYLLLEGYFSTVRQYYRAIIRGLMKKDYLGEAAMIVN